MSVWPHCIVLIREENEITWLLGQIIQVNWVTTMESFGFLSCKENKCSLDPPFAHWWVETDKGTNGLETQNIRKGIW